MERVLTTAQMAFCEKRSDQLGVSLGRLMDNAGEKLGRFILNICVKNMIDDVLILVGNGNNGGDGLCAGKFLYEVGINPTIILCCGEPKTELGKKAMENLPKGIAVTHFDENSVEKISSCGVLCDCIFGTGFHGSLRDNVLPIFKACNENKGIKIACDIPSGANARNGMADENTFKADYTLTFHRKKLGMLLSPAKYFCKEIIVEDICIPQQCEEELEFSVSLCDEDFVRENLPKRIPYGHKGTFGKAVLVCGSEKYIGASLMSTAGAMRSGVGLCELCTPKFVILALAGQLPECIFSKMECDSDGFMTSDNADEILKKLEKAQCLLIGCGLGNTGETRLLVKKLVEGCPSNCKIVIDADGINSLCENIDVLYKKKTDVILTPHPAELSRLCGKTLSQTLENRLEVCVELARKYNISILSKSCETIYVTPNSAIVISTGNTALSKGGSGDMLAGICASNLAQGSSWAGVLSSYILGSTAQMLAGEMSQRGIIASDILKNLPKYLKGLES